MAFIIIFVLTSLAIMLSGEIYKNGKNNAIVHSMEDVKELMSRIGLGRAAARFNKSAIGIGQAIVAFVLLMVVVLLVLKLALFIIGALLAWIIN
ncbi:hypothetical protein [Pseudomonas viridiflava]|uniref:hypothetical protein n=1 Tax=Pseudomonas viridiflava TaxID=33069 RepID=UPI000F044B21|nr:hypothetical protein [Pseudomonas viridiflava]